MGDVNWKLSYKLQQQTPLIHFQYNQSGATLRASEVKPKLDKFIISKLGKSNCKKEWYIVNTNALNYKMQIVANGIKTVSKPKKLTIAESIDLNIICFIPELRKNIDKYIAESFAVTNFGARQTKGFGGFSLIKDNKEPINEKNVIGYLKNNNYLFFYAQNLKKNPMNLAKAIYTSMKSYVNQVSGAEKDKNNNPVVQRFQSPVTIKIIGKTVIFIFNEELFKEICGKKFVFKFEKKQRKIAVPESIDVRKFIKNFVKYHNEQVNDGFILRLP